MGNRCAKTQRLTHHTHCQQMRAPGGDCFHFVDLLGRRVAVTAADASGKGRPAALIIAKVKPSLRTAALFAPEDAVAVVTAVNRQLHACSPADRYATLFYCAFDEDAHNLHYVNANQNPALCGSRRPRWHMPGSLCCLSGSLPKPSTRHRQFRSFRATSSWASRVFLPP
jgi:serine phosphatase RsbU (regulator of sigma subunit)